MDIGLMVGINLQNLTVREYQLLAEGILAIKNSDYFAFSEKDIKIIGELFDKLCEIENKLIAMGEM